MKFTTPGKLGKTCTIGRDDPGSSFTVRERIRGAAVTGAVPELR
ncbi:hypothetical protein LTSEURB_6734 [Salmonella enterica subsp. enterica serovar Urbana str. R8-2977]|uniref:Uncharacterized protein n=1 Tax=Salmonella enterica subsp. enterica serovar Urbana str. R8-2977 TaxID=913084 RepID=G5S5E0_SALET|nr:hypothetical protein LTSEURB_6734 [Salmonella enterica subsp. enterica serovar Urbana str. R8-2977]